MTRERIANMPGVRREGGSDRSGHQPAASRTTIYNRGHITVLERRAPEQRTCECYAVVKMD